MWNIVRWFGSTGQPGAAEKPAARAGRNHRSLLFHKGLMALAVAFLAEAIAPVMENGILHRTTAEILPSAGLPSPVAGRLVHAAGPQPSPVQKSDRSDSLGGNPLFRPKMILPDSVEGYTLVNIKRFAEADCPLRRLNPEALLEFRFQWKDSSLLAKATPLFVDILRRSPGGSLVQVYQEQFTLLAGENRVRITESLPPGEYELVYGFSFRDELTEKFPRRYGRRCRVSVTFR